LFLVHLKARSQFTALTRCCFHSPNYGFGASLLGLQQKHKTTLLDRGGPLYAQTEGVKAESQERRVKVVTKTRMNKFSNALLLTSVR
jgi:hypothetical protein